MSNLSFLIALGAENVDQNQIGVVLHLLQQPWRGQHCAPQAEDLSPDERVAVLSARHQMFEDGPEIVFNQIASPLVHQLRQHSHGVFP